MHSWHFGLCRKAFKIQFGSRDPSVVMLLKIESEADSENLKCRPSILRELLSNEKTT